jgi:hypothetical protein
VSSKAAVNAANKLLKDNKVSPANITGLEFTQVVGVLVLSRVRRCAAPCSLLCTTPAAGRRRACHMAMQCILVGPA